MQFFERIGFSQIDKSDCGKFELFGLRLTVPLSDAPSSEPIEVTEWVNEKMNEWRKVSKEDEVKLR